jgi:hypothetical protein
MHNINVVWKTGWKRHTPQKNRYTPSSKVIHATKWKYIEIIWSLIDTHAKTNKKVFQTLIHYIWAYFCSQVSHSFLAFVYGTPFAHNTSLRCSCLDIVMAFKWLQSLHSSLLFSTGDLSETSWRESVVIEALKYEQCTIHHAPGSIFLRVFVVWPVYCQSSRQGSLSFLCAPLGSCCQCFSLNHFCGLMQYPECSY